MECIMSLEKICSDLYNSHVVENNHQASDYFALIKALIEIKDGRDDTTVKRYIEKTYSHIADEIENNIQKPSAEVSFGTSGWRGILGKDIFKKSVLSVTAAIIELYQGLDKDSKISGILGVSDLDEARQRGCLVGHDNRFGGEVLCRAVADFLVDRGFTVYYCGETTTGVLSASLLELQAAFSVNLTPSHNPLEYGGYKYNAADGGPAASELTQFITRYSREIIASGTVPEMRETSLPGRLIETDSFALWQDLVTKNRNKHGIDYEKLCDRAAEMDNLAVVVDSVHGGKPPSH